MTINQIKELTKYLNEEEVEKIKKEIKSKEDVLKSGNLNEEEMIEVLNTLFAVLVIEKALESEIEDIENIREELELELIECYNTYDSYMSKYKKEDKKRKKRWLLEFLGLNENIRLRKQGISESSRTIDKLQSELNSLKQQKSTENLQKVVDKRNRELYDKFCRFPHECRDITHRHEHHRHQRPHRHHEHHRHNIEREIVILNERPIPPQPAQNNRSQKIDERKPKTRSL